MKKQLVSVLLVVKQDCFRFERRNKNAIFINLDLNPDSVKRIVVFELEAGDYFDRITITRNSGSSRCLRHTLRLAFITTE